MITKVARNVRRAKPKATATTIPATAPFESGLLGEADPLGRGVGVEGDETEL